MFISKYYLIFLNYNIIQWSNRKFKCFLAILFHIIKKNENY